MIKHRVRRAEERGESLSILKDQEGLSGGAVAYPETPRLREKELEKVN